jgi:hypothetical protein
VKQVLGFQAERHISEGLAYVATWNAARAEDVRTARKFALELSCRYSGQSQRLIGEYYGYRGNGSVLKQRKRLKELFGDNNKLRRRFERVEKALAGI